MTRRMTAFLVDQKRREKPNLETDFPIRLEKPVDTPYGAYADGFSPDQHKFGPFDPICARVKELAAASRTAKTVGADNGSSTLDPAR